MVGAPHRGEVSETNEGYMLPLDSLGLDVDECDESLFGSASQIWLVLLLPSSQITFFPHSSSALPATGVQLSGIL